MSNELNEVIHENPKNSMERLFTRVFETLDNVTQIQGDKNSIADEHLAAINSISKKLDNVTYAIESLTRAIDCIGMKVMR